MAKARLPVFITPEGYQKLKSEVDYLWKEERPRVTREVEAAAALGDRSENAEYQYGKRRLREIDRRLRFLSDRLDAVQVMHPPAQAAAGTDKAGPGPLVTQLSRNSGNLPIPITIVPGEMSKERLEAIT